MYRVMDGSRDARGLMARRLLADLNKKIGTD
jgi:hypothetical protein